MNRAVGKVPDFPICRTTPGLVELTNHERCLQFDRLWEMWRVLFNVCCIAFRDRRRWTSGGSCSRWAPPYCSSPVSSTSFLGLQRYSRGTNPKMKTVNKNRAKPGMQTTSSITVSVRVLKIWGFASKILAKPKRLRLVKLVFKKLVPDYTKTGF